MVPMCGCLGSVARVRLIDEIVREGPRGAGALRIDGRTPVEGSEGEPTGTYMAALELETYRVQKCP